MGNIDKDGKPGVPMRGMIAPNGLWEADKARAGLAMMRHRDPKGRSRRSPSYPEPCRSGHPAGLRTSRRTRTTSHE